MSADLSKHLRNMYNWSMTDHKCPFRTYNRYRWLGHFIHIRKDDEVPIVLGPFKIVKVTNVFRKCVAKLKTNEASVLIIIATSNAVICKPKSEKHRKKNVSER